MKMTKEMYTGMRQSIEKKHESLRHDIFVREVARNNNVWTNEAHRQMRDDRDVEEAEIAELRQQYYFGVEVGDGVTVHLWSDSHVYTVIKRTAKTITIQRDKAILNPEFKPEWIPGGFAGHCTNQDEQSYTYERNPNGEKLTLRWSEKFNSWRYLDKTVTMGRDEFYDYNF